MSLRSESTSPRTGEVATSNEEEMAQPSPSTPTIVNQNVRGLEYEIAKIANADSESDIHPRRIHMKNPMSLFRRVDYAGGVVDVQKSSTVCEEGVVSECEGIDSKPCTLEDRDLKNTNHSKDVTIQSDSDDELFNDEESVSEVKNLFHKARLILCPTKFYHQITYLYAERKLMVFFLVHFVSTMIVWSHFALRKLDAQLTAVPEAANRYWLKVVAPTLEFGAMHAILFQMALIPLTMSRFSIASLCDSVLNSILPLNRALRMHIHLGYTMIAIVFWATIFFFIFFGLLCSDGEEAFCEKFTQEIMITGYCILAFLLLVGFTSYFRHSIPYEIFYAIHHAVFIMYFVTIAHTLDVEARTGKERSQTFKWFTSTLLFYFCDRAAMYLNHKYTARLRSSAVLAGANGSRMIILKLKRPVLFQFKAGQYAFLRINSIDKNWHPFSIASGPESEDLEFYIEVQGDKSWSTQLCDILSDENKGAKSNRVRLFVDVMGPYGTSLASTNDYTHVLSLGSGTGIVPVLSLFKQHVRKMLALEPKAYLKELERREERIHRVQLEMEKRKGSIATKLGATCRRSKADISDVSNHDRLAGNIRESLVRHDSLDNLSDIRENMEELKQHAYQATRSLYGVVLLCFAPVVGVIVLGLTISWNTTEVELTPKMFWCLECITVFFQAIFCFVSLCIWNSNSMSNYIDLVFCILAPFVDWYWYIVYEERNMKLATNELILAALFHTYMTLRLWMRAVKPRHKSWKKHVQNDGTNHNLSCLEMVWTTRSASQVSEILPEILSQYNALIDAWGFKNAQKVCRVSIHVTDPDPVACSSLQFEMEECGIQLTFGRLDIAKWIQDHTLRMIDNHKRSYSLLAFCGSPKLAQQVHGHKISNDMITAITGYKRHQMEFVSESYGGSSSSKNKPSSQIDGTLPDAEEKSRVLEPSVKSLEE